MHHESGSVHHTLTAQISDEIIKEQLQRQTEHFPVNLFLKSFNRSSLFQAYLLLNPIQSPDLK